MPELIAESRAVRVSGLGQLAALQERDASAYASPAVAAALSDAIRWLRILHESLRHTPYLLCNEEGPQITGVLPLALVQSALFGKFLVSLPYVNSAGVMADNAP